MSYIRQSLASLQILNHILSPSIHLVHVFGGENDFFKLVGFEVGMLYLYIVK